MLPLDITRRQSCLMSSQPTIRQSSAFIGCDQDCIAPARAFEHKKAQSATGLSERRGWDSNPRCPRSHAGSQDQSTSQSQQEFWSLKRWCGIKTWHKCLSSWFERPARCGCRSTGDGSLLNGGDDQISCPGAVPADRQRSRGMGSQGFRVLLFGADLVLVSAMERLLLSQSDEFKK